MAAKKSPSSELEAWTELDLTAAAASGELRQAFEMDPILEQIGDVIDAGRHLILVGESGVGKTAALHELVRRLPGAGPVALRGRRILQLSFARRASGLATIDKLRPAMQKLVEELLARGREVVPFFRDVGIAGAQNLEAQLLALYLGAPPPVLAEGDRQAVAAMLEDEPELAEQCVVLEVDEPSLERTERLLRSWAEAQAGAGGPRFDPEALAEAAHLGHRFLARVRLPRKALNLLGEVGSLAGERPVTRADVIDRFCRAHRVPPLLVDPAVPLRLDELGDRLGAHVLGQEEAVQAMVRLVGMIKAGLSDVRRPFGVFLFVGPTGVGKTHLAQELARLLFGSRDRMVRLNMADFPKEDDVKVLLGDSEHYDPARKRGLLTRRLVGHPFAVVLFDEFEKAHPKVHDGLLQLMDEGAFINGAGETVSCRSCVLIATSNAGAELYRTKAPGFSAPADLAALDREVDRQLRQHFRFEFLNRFDEVVHFRPLGREHIRIIALRELEQLGRRSGLARRRLRLEADESVLDWLAVHGYDPLYGARVLRRTIERHVAMAVAETLVRADPPPGSTLELTVRRRGPEVHVRQGARPPAAPRAPVALPFGATERVVQLDAGALGARGRELAEAARPRGDWLEAQKRERDAVLDALNTRGGWDGTGEGQALLPRYRELDRTIRTAEHLLAPVQELERRLAGGVAVEALARAVERAAEAARRWEELVGQDEGRAAWMIISGVDPLNPAGRWLEDLVKLEQLWLRRLRLQSTVVACELVNDRPTRVFLDVDGPGASFYLSMEAGLHRFSPARGPVRKARVDAVARGAQVASGARAERGDPAVPVRSGSGERRAASMVRRHAGPFELNVCCRLRVELPGRGLVIELVGEDPATLGQLAEDLERAPHDTLTAPPAVARVYGEGGSGAHDPRTDARVRQLKDALKGKLDPLLDAWRERARAAPGAVI